MQRYKIHITVRTLLIKKISLLQEQSHVIYTYLNPKFNILVTSPIERTVKLKLEINQSDII